MNTRLHTLFLGGISLLAVGCDGVRDHASHMSGALGIPVNVAANVSDDERCLLPQLQRWSEEFQALDDQEKQDLTQAVSSQGIQSIDLKRTRVTRVRSGEYVSLELGYYRSQNYYVRRDYRNNRLRKSLLDTRQWVGAASGTQHDIQGGVLSIEHRMEKDNSIWRRYWTAYSDVYDAVSAADATFDQQRSNRNIQIRYEGVGRPSQCGDMPTLQDLILAGRGTSRP